jgi:hypothetical protein
MALTSVRLRLVTLATLAVLCAPGCRTGGLGNLTSPGPQVAPRSTSDIRRLLAAHNRNAERIASLDARPSIVIAQGRVMRGAPLDGRLAMERPRNFKLELAPTSGALVADIGSNDSEFWFLIKDPNSKEKAVYFCNYDKEGACPVAVGGLQPDWITEALGLRVVSDAEADEIKVTRGKKPGTLVLTHRPTRTGAGEAVTRVAVLNETNHRVEEYYLLSGDQKTMLAKAVISKDQAIVPEGDSEPVYFPQKLHLEWYREKLAMDATFAASTTRVNPTFDESRRAALFVEPTEPGYGRVDLARQAGAGRAPSSSIRESLPAPPAGVQLGEPETPSAGTDDEARKDRNPIALSADLPAMPSLASEVVGAPIPRAPEPEFQTAGGTSWQRSTAPPYER